MEPDTKRLQASIASRRSTLGFATHAAHRVESLASSIDRFAQAAMALLGSCRLLGRLISLSRAASRHGLGQSKAARAARVASAKRASWSAIAVQTAAARVL